MTNEELIKELENLVGRWHAGGPGSYNYDEYSAGYDVGYDSGRNASAEELEELIARIKL